MNQFKKSTIAVMVCGVFASGTAMAATNLSQVLGTDGKYGWYISSGDAHGVLTGADTATPEGQIDVHLGPRTDGQSNGVTLDGANIGGNKIVMSNSGAVEVNLVNGANAGYIDGGGRGKDTTVNINVVDSSLTGAESGYAAGEAIYIDAMDTGVHNITVQNSTLGGGIFSGGTNNIQITDSSVVNGNVTIGAIGSTAGSTVQVVGSSVTGNINGGLDFGNTVVYLEQANIGGSVSTGSGNDGVILDKGTVVAGDIKLGAGDDVLLITGGSTIEGNVDGGAGQDVVGIENGSTIVGDVSNVELQANLGVFEGSVSNTTIDLTNGSQATIGNMSNTSIEMSSDSRVTVAGNITGQNSLVVGSLAPNQPLAPSTELGQITGTLAPDASFDVSFANGQATAEARSSAYVNAVELEKLPLDTTFGEGFTVVLNAQPVRLAADVQAHVAGLDAADKLGRAVGANLSDRLGTLRGSRAEGAQLWGNLMYRSGDVNGNVDYESKLQGVQTGIDWSAKLRGGDRVSMGVAFAHATNEAQNAGGAEFQNKAKGDFVSVYGGWAQSLEQRNWGLFVEGSASFGSLRFSQSSRDVGNATTGALESLSSSYDGNSVALEARGGASFLVAPQTLVQPYALVGWNRVKADAFSNAQVDFAANSESSTYAGLGIKASRTHLVGNTPVNAWVDASYIKDLSTDGDIRVADFTLNDPLKQKGGAIAAGFDAQVSKDLSVGLGLSYGFGDVQGLGAKIGVNYRF